MRNVPSPELRVATTLPVASSHSWILAAGRGRAAASETCSRTRPSRAAARKACWRGIRLGGPASRDCCAAAADDVVCGCCALAADKNSRLNARAAPARSGARRCDLGGKTTLIFSRQPVERPSVFDNYTGFSAARQLFSGGRANSRLRARASHQFESSVGMQIVSISRRVLPTEVPSPWNTLSAGTLNRDAPINTGAEPLDLRCCWRWSCRLRWPFF